ncbi:MAG: aspartate carbamoyltransferase [Nitrososphaeria archaeon]|nr:aspartate carbamoyltransferase [Conexivisphaerales archaeon]
MSLKGRDIISAKDLSREEVEFLIKEAETYRNILKFRKPLFKAEDKTAITVFLEPSTRTRLSFQFAGTYLGIKVLDFGATEISSIQKGETFEDTMTMVDGYEPDVIILRQSVAGNAEKAAKICKATLINAGDGINEHPTQALTDVYTLYRIFGRIDGLRIGIMGDLKYGRTVKSLSIMLDKFKDIKLYYVSPPSLKVRDDVLNEIKNVDYEFAEKVEDVADKIDALYVTRIQKERFADPSEYEKLKGSYKVTKDMLMKLKKIPYILHPLPRVDELTPDVDELPQAKYFEQAKNGMFIRIALLKNVLGI